MPQSRKTRALLAYLAVVNKPQRRERLCELFWEIPDDPRGALRWSLSKLRQIVNADGVERLHADRNFVHLRTEGIELDYELIRGLAADSVGSLPTEQLERVTAAFAGPFLADLYLPRCSAYEAWRSYCANEAELLHLKALRTLVDRLAGDPERALAHVHALQTLLPEEDFGKEIARINERAKLTAAAAPAPDPAITEVSTASAPDTGLPIPAPPEAAAIEPAAPFRQEVRFTTARDGVRIAYAISGSGPPVLRASHWMSHLEFDRESPVWGHWIDSLSDGFTLIRYDGRLNGLSDAACEDLSLDAFISDLESVVEAAGLDRFVLLGISQGGALSLEYASRHPERVAGLVLCGAYARGWRARNDSVEIGWREAINAQLRQSWGQDDPIFRQMFTNRFIPGANRAQMDWFNELQRRTLTPENAWRLSNAFAEVDVSSRLERLRVPAAVWHARSDRVVPLSEGVELAERVPGARFCMLESSNHILLGDEPAFQDFINGAKAFAHEVLDTPSIAPVDRRTRRQATILCADFVSPGQALDDAFPERAIELIDPVIMRAIEIVQENGGAILSVTDAELSASFGAPAALEGHAALACRAALAIMEMCAKDQGGQVLARIGLDTGVVIVGPSRVGGHDSVEVRGPPVTTAGAIAQLLECNAVAATERTRQSAGGFAAMELLAPDAVAGTLKEQLLYQVRDIKHGQSRWHLRAEKQLSPFIGRELQLQLLNRAWREAGGGEGQTVFLVGDPGIGKSRVTHEFVGAIPDEEAECLEAGALETDLRAGLVVIRRLLQGLFDVADADPSAIAIDKVKAAQARRGFDARLLAPLLAAMDLPVDDPLWRGLSAAERARRVREGVVALILSLAVSRPVVLLIEDLHWIDAESEVILVRLAEALRSGRLLMMATCRPEYDRRAFADVGPVEIKLTGFSSAETAELLDHILGRASELDRLRTHLTEMCRGNALFLEETVRALVASGRLAGSPGQYRPQGTIGEIGISPSIHAIIDARFERLEPDAKWLAQIASIFGGEIPGPLLRRLGALPDARFDAALQALKAADILIEVQIFPESILRFKHALIRNSIASRLLSSARIELNRAALRGLKSFYADRLEEHVERLARHAIDAESWEEAVTYLLASAWKAIRRSAHDAALAELDLGIRVLRDHREVPDGERREIEFQLARGVALMAARGWGSEAVLEAFERAEALCESTGDQSRLFSTLRGRAQYYMISGKPAAAQELADRCARIVHDSPDPGLRIETDHMFWTNNFFLGNIATARSYAENAIACYDAERDHRLTYIYSGHDPGVCCHCFAGLSAWLGGDSAGARQRCSQAVELAEQLQHPLTMALAYWSCGYLHLFAGEPEDALLWAERELSTAERFQFPLLVGQAGFQIGWAQFRLGERITGLQRMEDGIAAIRRTGAEMGLPYFIALYAEALSALDRLDDAAASIRAAIDLGRQNGTQFQLADVLTIEALVSEKRGASQPAVEKGLRRAIKVAAAQQSLTGELRAASELAGRLRQRGRMAEAATLIDGYSAWLEPHGTAAAKVGNDHDG